MSDLGAQMNEMGARARAAASILAYASSDAKTKALLFAADAMIAATDHIVAENAKDLDFGREKGLTEAMMNRLMLDAGRIAAMAEGLRTIAGQEDPVGEVIAQWDQPSGLHIRRVRTPLVSSVLFMKAAPMSRRMPVRCALNQGMLLFFAVARKACIARLRSMPVWFRDCRPRAYPKTPFKSFPPVIAQL